MSTSPNDPIVRSVNRNRGSEKYPKEQQQQSSRGDVPETKHGSGRVAQNGGMNEIGWSKTPEPQYIAYVGSAQPQSMVGMVWPFQGIANQQA